MKSTWRELNLRALGEQALARGLDREARGELGHAIEAERVGQIGRELEARLDGEGREGPRRRRSVSAGSEHGRRAWTDAATRPVESIEWRGASARRFGNQPDDGPL